VEKNGLSLEDLVTRVFMLLSVLAIGFALSWYLFPRVMVVPVPVDPRTGLPIDPSMDRILSDPRDADPNTQGAAPKQPGQSLSSSPGSPSPELPTQGPANKGPAGKGASRAGEQKGNDAKPK
jgi:hypothetical protein